MSQIFFTNNGVQRMVTSKQYDLLNRLTNISSAPSASSAVSLSYAYNSAEMHWQEVIARRSRELEEGKIICRQVEQVVQDIRNKLHARRQAS